MTRTHAGASARAWMLRAMIGLGVGLVVLCVAAHWIDARAVVALDRRAANVEGEDWYRLLRVIGFAGTWVVVGVGLMLVDSGRGAGGGAGGDAHAGGWRGAMSRGPFVVGCALLAGVLAEGLKLVVRRGRPDAAVGHEHVFWPWAKGDWTPAAFGWTRETLKDWGWEHFPGAWNTSDFGLPSSHAATAFGGMVAVWWLWPRAGWVVLPLAAGCALTRTMDRAHYVTDIAAGAALGVWVVVGLVWAFGGAKGGRGA